MALIINQTDKFYKNIDFIYIVRWN